MSNSACKVVFLDRDGTINVDHGYVYHVDDWELTDDAAEAIAMLQSAGFRLAVVTNQSGIASGKYSKSDVDRLHDHMLGELALAGATIDAIAVCPHASDDDCDCRKPKTGMAAQIAAQLNQPIDYERSWTIGDKLSDVGFGAALGTSTALIRSRYWDVDALNVKPTLIVDSLFGAAEQITGVGRSDVSRAERR